MYSVRVTTTSDRDMTVVDLGPGLTWERLTDVLRSQVSPQAAALFAEPIPDPARGVTHWHVVADDDPIPFLALPKTGRENLLATYHKLERDILAFAHQLLAKGGESNLRLATGLRTALETTEPSAQLWSVSGEPVVTGWGRRKETQTRLDAHILSREKTKDEPHERLRPFITRFRRADLKEEAAVGLATVSVAARSFLPWTLWILFSVIAASIFYHLLPACAIDLPVLRHVAGQCGGEHRAALRELIDHNDALRQAVWEAERRLANLAQDCASATSTESNQPPSLGDIAARRRETKAASGLLEITLAWDGREDLDLHVFCPDGHLFYGQKDACGGTLDIDRNSTPATAVDHPIEHATWLQEPAKGAYRIVVMLYSTNGSGPRPVPFRVVIREGDSERNFEGVVDKEHAEVEVTNWHH